MRHLQHEVLEEILSRHRSSFADALSIYGQPAPSPIDALSDDEDELLPCKRPRLFMDDDDKNDKENVCEDRLIDVGGDKENSSSLFESNNILREACESYTVESLPHSRLSSPS